MDFHYMGRLKRGISVITESPLEEVWSLVRRYATREMLESYIYAGGELSKEEVVEYCRARFRQTSEFRETGRGSTLVTRPLTLYYSILNLTRAVVVLRSDRHIEGGHGLGGFTTNTDLLACSVKTSKTGTFPALWQMYPDSGEMPDTITLRDCLSQIPEVLWSFNSPFRGRPLCTPVDLEIFSAGKAILSFRNGIGSAQEFAAEWKGWFPRLAELGGVYELTPGGVIRVVLPEVLVNRQDAKADQTKVFEFTSKHLISDLTSPATSMFYLVRRQSGVPVLRRELAYLGAMHILSSVVRYEPEALLQSIESSSEIAWFLERVLQAVERYYPQLLMSVAESRDIYFSHAE